MINLGEKIYELRQKNNMSQGDLAELLGVSRQSISKWENNSTVPEIGKLVQMCDIFCVSLDELVRDINLQCTDERRVEQSSQWEEKWLGIQKRNWVNFGGFVLVIRMLYIGCLEFFARIIDVISNISYHAQYIDAVSAFRFTFREYNKWYLLIAILGLAISVVALKFLRVIVKGEIEDNLKKGTLWIGWYLILHGNIGVINRVFLINGELGMTYMDVVYVVKYTIMVLGGIIILLSRKCNRKKNKVHQRKRLFRGIMNLKKENVDKLKMEKRK